MIEVNTTAFDKKVLIPSNSSLSLFICKFPAECYFLEGLVADVSSATLLGGRKLILDTTEEFI